MKGGSTSACGWLRGERGFAMVEVIVGALLLAGLALAMLPLMDAGALRTASNRARGIASSLANSDLERMRAMDVRDLSNHRRSQAQNVGGVAYTVTSRADWVRDASGPVGCTAESASVDYLRIRSTVTWPAMAGVAPVVAESLVAPPVGSFGSDRGSLVVQLQRANGDPVAGLPVGATGTGDTTNEAGCATFGMLPAGPATVTFGRPGWVIPAGQEQVSLTASVVAGQTSTSSWLYDEAGTVAVSFDTKPQSGAPAVATQSASVSAAHSSLAAPRQFVTASAQSQITAGQLFPFTSAYGVYAGSCSGNDPTQYDASYYSSNPGLVAIAPGQAAPPVTVRMPSVWVRVQRLGVPHSGARITVRTTESGCAATFPAYTADSSGEARIALPFGPYELCATDTLGRRVKQTVTNSQPGGLSSPVVLNLPLIGVQGCP